LLFIDVARSHLFLMSDVPARISEQGRVRENGSNSRARASS
jgi:hypothetical protein